MKPTLIVTRCSTALGLGLASLSLILSQLTARTSKRAQSQRDGVQYRYESVISTRSWTWYRTVWLWYRLV